MQKHTKPEDALIDDLIAAAKALSESAAANAGSDMTFTAAVLGVNDSFSDKLDEDTKLILLERYRMMRENVPEELTLYTFAVNGDHYIKPCVQDFGLLETIRIKVPRGDWAQMYIEPVRNQRKHSIYVCADDPRDEHDVTDGDKWIKLTDEEEKQFDGAYRYGSGGWELMCSPGEQGQHVFLGRTAPQDAHDGDIWLKILGSAVTRAYIRTNGGWSEQAGFPYGVGEALGSGNERFSDYSGNLITNSQNCSVFGRNNWAENCQCSILGGRNVTAKNAQYSLLLKESLYFGENAGDTMYGSFVGGAVSHIRGTVRNCVLTGQGSDCKNIYDSLLCGSLNTAGDYRELYTEKGCVKNSIVCGDQNYISSLKNGIVCGYGNSVDPGYDSDTIDSTLHGLIMGGRQGDCTSPDQLLIIGNGRRTSNNALTLYSSGDMYIQGTLYQNGGDYAETYEWLDGNPYAQDRTGLFVTLDGEKIILADSGSDYILGAVSAAPTVCGDTFNNCWKGKFVRDIFGSILLDENGDMTVSGEYDPDRKYIPQSKRPEKAAVGTHGKLVVRDDGTCRVNGYCRPSDGGIATASAEKTDYRVIERRDENHIRIVIK